MTFKAQAIAVLCTGGLFLFVFELVRRKRLLERYALLWLFASAILLGFAIWTEGLLKLASLVGIYYAPSALFAVAFGFVLALLLHFSVQMSRLSDQNKVLAQRVSRLQQQIDLLAADSDRDRDRDRELEPH
jgi:hypothetical protein